MKLVGRAENDGRGRLITDDPEGGVSQYKTKFRTRKFFFIFPALAPKKKFNSRPNKFGKWMRTSPIQKRKSPEPARKYKIPYQSTYIGSQIINYQWISFLICCGPTFPSGTSSGMTRPSSSPCCQTSDFYSFWCGPLWGHRAILASMTP